MAKKIAQIDWGALESTAAKNIAGKTVGDVIGSIIPYILSIAGFLLLFLLLYSGFQYMTGEGDPKKLDVAKKNITYSIIGFIVVLVAYWAAGIVGEVLNLKNVTGSGGLFQ